MINNPYDIKYLTPSQTQYPLKGRFNPLLAPKVLKYCKVRDPGRVLSRKWSAYSKLT